MPRTPRQSLRQDISNIYCSLKSIRLPLSLLRTRDSSLLQRKSASTVAFFLPVSKSFDIKTIDSSYITYSFPSVLRIGLRTVFVAAYSSYIFVLV